MQKTKIHSIPSDSVQTRGALCGLGMVFIWSFLGYFQTDFPFYVPIILTVLSAVAIHDMGFEFPIISISLVAVHSAVIVYCMAWVSPIDYEIFKGAGLVWGLATFLFGFFYLFFGTSIFEAKEILEPKIPTAK